MKAKLLSGIIAATFLAAAGPSLAIPIPIAVDGVITLTPSLMIGKDYTGEAEPEIFFDVGFVDAEELDGLTLLYKAEVDRAKEEGKFDEFYNTVFSDTKTDPENALITWTGTSLNFMNCITASCFLAIKDGNESPNNYAYNLTGWNGKDSLYLTGFWPKPGNGAISHVSIWGLEDGGSTGQDVPEPGPLSLLGLGLMGLWFARRKTSA